MKLLIIGATRGVGAQLLEQSLAEGHPVTALARNPGKVMKRPGRLRVLPGDILDRESVERAVREQDAVCIAVGRAPTWRRVTLFSDGTRNVIGAMERYGVKTLICVTGIGAGDSRGHGGFLYDRIVRPCLLKTIYEDKDVQETWVRESPLDWVIVRPGFLTNGPKTGRYRVVTELEGVTAGKISRADVAHFILTQLEHGSYVKQTVLLT